MRRSDGTVVVVVVAALMVLLTASAQESTTPCPMVTCAPGCEPFREPNGCSKCECPLTCENVTCTEDEQCVLEEVQCIRAPCFPVPTCVPKNEATTPCPMVTCAPGCEPVRQPNGCSECECPRTCENVTCTEDEQCVLKDVLCIRFPCFPIPTCVPKNKSTTPCPMVTCAPGCEPVRQPNGCSKCECPLTCENVTCTEDEKCVLKQWYCFTTPCFPVPTCVPKNVSTTPCPTVTCAPGCEPVRQPNGCSKCECPLTCENVTCTEDEQCVLKQRYCLIAPCFPVPTCVPKNETTIPCPLIRCVPGCGLLRVPNGCPKCFCPPTCKNVTCTEDEQCVLKQWLCFTTPCLPKPTCVPKNGTTTPRIPDSSTTRCVSDIVCRKGCKKLIGSDRCPYCQCPPTCEVIDCRDGYECKMQVQPCRVQPCPKRPVCVPMNSCTGIPSTKRCNNFTIPWLWFWFYNSSANACQKFSYLGCTPGPNAFLTQKACEDKCKRRDSLICPLIGCGDDCYTFNRRNQCPQCICPNPCKNFTCTEDQVCKLRDVTCITKPCNPEPYCAPKSSCPIQPPCGIRCMNGLKTDKNGCQLCECL